LLLLLLLVQDEGIAVVTVVVEPLGLVADDNFLAPVAAAELALDTELVCAVLVSIVLLLLLLEVV
jgi:hypothetical protein